MKAAVRHCYGSPDVVRYEDIPKPSPKDNEVLVRVHAASVNPLDWHELEGTPYLVRMDDGFGKPDNPRLGVDFAGTVRSEEHTSELQSRGQLVCRLLLEKKNSLPHPDECCYFSATAAKSSTGVLLYAPTA